MPRHATGLGASGFPAANKLLMRYEADRAYKIHQQKLQSTRHKLDVKEPKRRNHLILRLKQIQKEEERQAEIDHENKILLNKMTNVMKYGGNIDNWNNYESRSLNFPLRERQNEEIARQNISIARRLETVRPGLKINSWERDFQQHRYIRSMWNDSTKDFGEFSPRRYRSRMSHARSMDNLDDTYDEDFESESAETEDKHLPKLSKHRKDTRKAKSESNAPTSPRKEEHRMGGARQTKLPKIIPHRAEDGATVERKKEDKEDKSDVAQLFKIAKQLGKPEDIFIKTLIKKTHKQRMVTKSKFRQKYDLDLITELKNGLGTQWEVLIDALLQERGVADAYSIFDALSTEDVIDVVELLATRNNTGIAELKESYRKEFSISLEEDMADRTPKPVQSLLIVLQKGTRDESTEVDEEEATKDAEDIFNAGEGRWEMEDEKFLQLLNVQSFAHMKCVFVKYKQVSDGVEILHAMKEDCDKTYFQALKVLVSCVVNPEVFLASQLRKHKNSTDPLFINILVLRSEIDMPVIRKVYKKTYGIDVAEEIKSQPHPTQKCLVELTIKGDAGKDKGGEGKKAGNMASLPPQQPPKESAAKKQQGKKTETKAKAEQESGAKNTESSAKSKQEEKAKQSKGKQDNPENHQDGNSVAAGSKPKKAAGADGKPKTKTNNGTVVNNGTIKATNNFRPDDDSDRLNNALTADPVNDSEVLAIITKRSNKQRQELKKVYEKNFKKNLMIDMDSEMTGDTEEITFALMMTPVEYDAYCVHEAVEGLGTSEPVLIAVLCTRPGADILSIKDAYKTAYKSDMVQDVTRDSSGDCKTLLTMLCQGKREPGTAVDMNQADKDAKALAESFDPTSDLYKALITERNHYQVKATFDSYKKAAGQDISSALTKADLGDDTDTYISIAQAVEDPVLFHSDKIQNCFINMGVNDNLLIRMVVPRSEVDLLDIKSHFQDVAGTSLYQTVNNKCQGDYKDLLLAVIDK